MVNSFNSWYPDINIAVCSDAFPAVNQSSTTNRPQFGREQEHTKATKVVTP